MTMEDMYVLNSKRYSDEEPRKAAAAFSLKKQRVSIVFVEVQSNLYN